MTISWKHLGLLLLLSPVCPARATEFFMTHHSPIGAWSSLTFGLPGMGVGIETETPGVQASGDLLVAFSRGSGKPVALPFLAAEEIRMAEGPATPKWQSRGWDILPSTAVSRILTGAVDQYAANGISLRVVSPRMLGLSPSHPTEFSDGLLPALLLEVEVDNAGYDTPATGFIGVAYKGVGRIRSLDWSRTDLAGVGFKDAWVLAALKDDADFTIRAGTVSGYVQKGVPYVHGGGNEGGIGFTVPARSKRTLTAVFAFYRGGNHVAQGLEASYAYTASLGSAEDVALAALRGAHRIESAAAAFDASLAAGKDQPKLGEFLAQASQAYYANTSLLRDGQGKFYWSVCEGAFAWRNTMDLAADHLPFELAIHPWVTGNIIDGFIDRYSYHDSVRFAPGAAPSPGGLSFTHDQGNFTAYSPSGAGGYERANLSGVYSFMTTEELLNGIYCAAAYALKGNDPEWGHRRLPVAREMLTSIENREGPDAAHRLGILGAESEKVGTGSEITTYDALDPSLQKTRGNIYIVVKTWCAAALLQRWFTLQGDQSSATRAGALAARVGAALTAHFDSSRGAFPPNLLNGGNAFVSAAIEPLAVPLFCGLGENNSLDPKVVDLLRRHAKSCLQVGRCIDARSGALRLSSSSLNTWPSKTALTLACASWLFGQSPRDVAPTAYDKMIEWAQISARRVTISDQIDASDGRVMGALYYPRIVSAYALVGRTQPSKK